MCIRDSSDTLHSRVSVLTPTTVFDNKWRERERENDKQKERTSKQERERTR